MLKLSVLILLLMFLLPHAKADPIDLTCTDKKTYGFRYDSPLTPSWGPETFDSTWKIQYDGSSDQAFIDGKPAMAIKGNGTVILIEYSANRNSQSLWSYAIHLQEQKVAAAQVNVYDLMGVGIKSRSVEFDCK